MNFYGVRGLLVRRRTPVRRGVALEMWNGDRWVPYTDVDAVLRHGCRLTEAQALAMLQQSGDRVASTSRLSDQQAHQALRAPGKVA